MNGVIRFGGDKAGEAFVSPKGFTGTWDVRSPARKPFAIYLQRRRQPCHRRPT